MPFAERVESADELVLEGTLPAPPEVVFDWLVEPDRLAQWWPPVAEVDLRVGGAYHFAWPNMDWHLRGEYSDVRPGQRLAFTWRWDHEPDVPERQVALGLAVDPAGTRLTVRHGRYDDSPADAEERQGHRDGWLHFLAVLEEKLAGGEAAGA